MTWEFREHTADLRVAFRVSTLEQLFADAVRLIRQLVAGDAAPGGPRERHKVELVAADPAELLFGFLRELLFLFETRRFVPVSLDLHRLEPTGVTATVVGEAFDPGRHEAQPEVKAVTRHGLFVVERDGRWEAEVVFDL